MKVLIFQVILLKPDTLMNACHHLTYLAEVKMSVSIMFFRLYWKKRTNSFQQLQDHCTVFALYTKD